MIDELTPIAVYMANEMNANAHGPDCVRMARLNGVDSTACITEYFSLPWWRRLFGAMSPQYCTDIEVSSHEAALMMWTRNVMQNGNWDHKPFIRSHFHSASTHSGIWHRYDKTDYFYDIWSNIHYGYVGSAAGFDESTLLDGAGLEQIGTDVLRGRMPRSTPGVDGLRGFDDSSDRTSISMGIEFYSLVPSHVSPKELVATVLMTAGLDTRSAGP